MILRSGRQRRTGAMVFWVFLLISSGILIDRVWLRSKPETTSATGSHGEAQHSVDGQGANPSDETSPGVFLSDPEEDPADVPGLEHSEGLGHAEGGEAEAAVELSQQALAAIGLTTAVADLRPTEETLEFPGVIRMHPDGVASVSTRIQGKVLSAAVAPGDRVKRGQVLARIQSLVPGNPPPTVDLVAPISGIVMNRNAVVGEAVQPNKELFRLIDPRQVVAEALVPERVVDRVRLNGVARVHRLRDHEEWNRLADHDEWKGRVTFVGSEADPESRTYPVWISLSSNRGALPRPGLFVEVLVVQSVRTALSVPQAAIVEDGPLDYVFVKHGDEFHRRLVSTGTENSRNAEILSGVSPGDTVAVRGSYELLLAMKAAAGSGPTGEAAPHEH